MQVSVEAPSKIERRITIVVPVEKLDEAFDKRIQNVAKNAKVAGFRPGKVPLAIVKQRYGDSARNEALSEVIQTSLYAAINQEKLQPIGVPTVEPKVVVPNQPLEFIATFEVLPEIGTVQFDLSTLDKQMATITDADIEKVLNHLQSQHANWKKVDRAAQEKDQVVVDFSGSIDGKLFEGGQAKDYTITLGSKSMIPGFEEGITGMKPSEEKVIKITFPSDYFAKDVAGKAAEFTIKVNRVLEPELPAMDEAFIKKMGIKGGSLEELRKEIRKNLERELERVTVAKLKNQVFDVLLKQNELEIPKALIEREANRIHDEVHPNHGGHAHSHSEAEMATFNHAAKRNVSLGLLVAELAKQHKMAINKEQVQAFIEKITGSYEDPTEALKYFATNKQARAEVEMQVLEQQVVDKLLENVKVTEKMLSYSELMNQ